MSNATTQIDSRSESQADLVHAINSPLAYSLLSAQIALRSLNDDDNPAVRRCIERAIEGIHRASTAAHGLLSRE